jgi:hypothetical protein
MGRQQEFFPFFSKLTGRSRSALFPPARPARPGEASRPWFAPDDKLSEAKRAGRNGIKV